MNRTTGTRLQVAVVILAVALVQAGCRRTFVVKVTGRVDQFVSFSFHESAEQLEPIKLNIVELSVQERRGDDWVTVWLLTGRQSLDSVRYGDRIAGLSSNVGPAPLVSTGTYRVAAKDSSWPGPPGLAQTYFSFDKEGRVRIGAASPLIESR